MGLQAGVGLRSRKHFLVQSPRPRMGGDRTLGPETFKDDEKTNAFPCCLPQFQVLSIFSSSLIGAVFSDKLGMCFAKYCTDPRNDRISFTFRDDLIF